MITIHNKKISYWFLSVLFLLWIMVMLGGATRLTQSGLSIVEWKPVTGVIPPLSHADWMGEFSKYQASPEYQQVNAGMPLGDFKFIYWMEFLHRLLGRLIGLAVLIPLLLWWRQLTTETKKHAFIILSLGAAQGFMGWYMVKSGLSKEPHVSHYRLTAHLGLAFIIFSYILWIFAQINGAARQVIQKRSLLITTCVLTILAFIYGGFTAGLKAGWIYNEFPLMGSQLFPEDGLFLSPIYKNFLNNQATVQWVHRLLATLVLLHVVLFHRNIQSSLSMGWLLAVIGQYVLGVLTLLYQVPVVLGTIHQSMAVIVLGFMVLNFYMYGKKACVLTNKVTVH